MYLTIWESWEINHKKKKTGFPDLHKQLRTKTICLNKKRAEERTSNFHYLILTACAFSFPPQSFCFQNLPPKIPRNCVQGLGKLSHWKLPKEERKNLLWNGYGKMFDAIRCSASNEWELSSISFSGESVTAESLKRAKAEANPSLISCFSNCHCEERTIILEVSRQELMEDSFSFIFFSFLFFCCNLIRLGWRMWFENKWTKEQCWEKLIAGPLQM